MSPLWLPHPEFRPLVLCRGSRRVLLRPLLVRAYPSYWPVVLVGLSAHGGSTHVSVCHPRPAASWSGLVAPVGLVPGVGCWVVGFIVAGGWGVCRQSPRTASLIKWSTSFWGDVWRGSRYANIS